MRRGRILILLALILLLGVAAAYLVLRPDPDEVPPEDVTETFPADMTFVVVAGQDISRGAVIPADGGVVISSMPRDLVVETMISGPDEAGLRSRVVGRRARMDITRGVFITEGMLTEDAGTLVGVGSDASLAIEPGMTAISIPMNRLSGVAYALRDGDSVDVLITMLMVDVDADFQSATPNMITPIIAPGGTEDFPAPYITAIIGYNIEDDSDNPLPPVPLGKVEVNPDLEQPVHLVPQEQQRPRLVSQRLVEQATVLHVGTFPLPDEPAPVAVPEDQGIGAPAPQQPSAAVEVQRPPDIVTLIVTPQEALALNWAVRTGADLVLTLRAPGDLERTEVTSVTLQYLLDTYNISVPTKLPYALEPGLTQVIRPILPNDIVITIE
jgi:Flp pilus assembly protein CpaB